MKRVKALRGYVIGLDVSRYCIFNKDEWNQPVGYRVEEWNTDTLDEALEFIRGLDKYE